MVIIIPEIQIENFISYYMDLLVILPIFFSITTILMIMVFPSTTFLYSYFYPWDPHAAQFFKNDNQYIVAILKYILNNNKKH